MDDSALAVRITDDTFLTPAEIAKVLRVSTITVVRAIRCGKLKALRVGSQWRILPSDLLAYVEDQTRRRKVSTEVERRGEPEAAGSHRQ